MRILQIRFRNLNSLVGEWEVDLTHPAYLADGIFAITGPTGAGKTTLLDALCLALYGRTPRLSKVTKSVNEIMSRQTGDCFAEVTFETLSGRFRCHWSQHRARKKPGAELQIPKHEVANADSGEILASSLRDVADQIEALTGMDFDRFTRSMLLAQGGFAAFLQAAPDDRAPILEQITGTEIYSQISMRVHESHRDARETLNVLRAQTSGIVILEPAQEQALQVALAGKQQQEAVLVAESAQLAKEIAWLTGIEQLKSELAGLDVESTQLSNELESFKPTRQRLALAQSAAALDGAYATVQALRKQQGEDEAALQAEKAGLPGLEAAVTTQAQVLAAAEQQVASAKEALKVAGPVLQQVRLLDHRLADQATTLQEATLNAQLAGAKVADIEQGLKQSREKREQALRSRAGADAYLAKHARDERLLSDLTGIEALCSGLQSSRHDIAQKELEQRQALSTLEHSRRSLHVCQEQGKAAQEKLAITAAQLEQAHLTQTRLLEGRLLREYRAEKDALLREMALLTKIIELEDHRARLEAGKPCPLCGATEHPFADGRAPVVDGLEQQVQALTQRIAQAETQEAAIREVEAEHVAAREGLMQSQVAQATMATSVKAAEQALARMGDALEKSRTDFTAQRRVLADRLEPLGETLLMNDELSSVPVALRARRDEWQRNVALKAEVNGHIADIDTAHHRLVALHESLLAVRAEKQQLLAVLVNEHAATKQARKALYGDKHPDDEWRHLSTVLEQTELAARTDHTRLLGLTQQSQAAVAQIQSLQKRLAANAMVLSDADTDFQAALTASGFGDELAFLAARLDLGQRNDLLKQARQLDDRHIELNARKNDRHTRLCAELALELTAQPGDALGAQLKAGQAALSDARQAVASLKHQLSENEAARERIKEKQAAIDAQLNECRRWETLHELIGSADGKKYRNFAQGLTFEMMVRHANRQLQKMTDRYVLVRDNAQPLELNVIDNYQAGEIRSTKNLSGGESFIVSLSLALGLSSMASRNVRIDSLFLDEGFGTLDEEALDTALETLAGLQQEGKLIGIISHVAALKERISTQIQVAPLAGGRSELQGPGCRKAIP